jgi:2,3,4,5-tetrahydropyridine-2,6-dicarboxylate N-succinyltransferase
LLAFRLYPNQIVPMGTSQCFDKLALKYGDADYEKFSEAGVRLVPGAIVRRGAYLAPHTIMMPAFVNIGAYVDTGTMIDTWAAVGSCAQIGKHVHLSGGVGIGGVLEPLQAKPTIIEDNVFVGARSEIVEGVIVEKNAVISMGVFIGQSTKIYDRESGEIFQGRVPEGAVVVPGSLPSQDGRYALNAAIIVKRVDATTRAKVSINELLRETTC